MSNKIKTVNNKRNKIKLSMYNSKNIKQNPKNYEYWSLSLSKIPLEPSDVWSCGECGGGGGGGESRGSGGWVLDDELPFCIYSK